MPSLRLLLGAAALAAAWLLPASARAGSCPDGLLAVTHEVEPGETLSEIASEHGVGYKQIPRWNPGLDPDLVRPGQKLTICREKAQRRKASCGGGGVLHEHEVDFGETLSGIAGRYGVDAAAIVRRNPELAGDPDALQPGQVLRVCTVPSRARASSACQNRTPLHRHEVVPGEWLAEIASRYGVRRRDLFRLNPRIEKHPDLLRPGDIVLVCPDIAPRERTELWHTVEAGETFGEIALRYGVSQRQLLRFQEGKLADKQWVREGTRLRVWTDGAILPGYGAYEDGKGALPSGLQLPPGRHYVVKHPSLAWGAPKTIQAIQSAVSRYRARTSSGPKIHVGDISKKGGGSFPPHKSHRTGLDVDMGYVLKGDLADEVKFRRATKATLDVARTWNLIQSFLDTDRVRYIFMDYSVQALLYEHAKGKGASQDLLDELFQYPRGKRRQYGLIRHEPGHGDHFHVRFES